MVQGFGNVGYYATIFLQSMGCKIAGVSEASGGIHSTKGLPVKQVMAHKRDSGSCQNFPSAEDVSNEDLLELQCNILIPAAMEGQITRSNADRIKATLVVEGANGPTTPAA